MSDDQEPSRRRALKALAVLGGGIGCAAVVIPAMRLALGAGGGGSEIVPWIRSLRLLALTDGVPKRVPLVADRRDAWTLERSVELGPVWLLRNGSHVKAWSAVCPHLGCAVDLRPSGPGFYCACHDSSFDPAGRRATGPSPRDLDALATRIVEGYVLVEFRRFRHGTSDKVPLG